MHPRRERLLVIAPVMIERHSILDHYPAVVVVHHVLLLNREEDKRFKQSPTPMKPLSSQATRRGNECAATTIWYARCRVPGMVRKRYTVTRSPSGSSIIFAHTVVGMASQEGASHKRALDRITAR